MASRRTVDTELLTVRQVFAYNPNNSVIPALRCLTTDGAGGTFWAIPSTLGGIPAFNKIVVNGSSFLATAPTNSLSLNFTDGFVSEMDVAASTVTVASAAFTEFDISGGNSLIAFSNGVITPSIRFVGTDGIRLSADPLTNTFFIQGCVEKISTGVFAYAQINAISNASTQTLDALNNVNNTFLTATSPSTVLQLVGVGDIQLTTNVTSNAIFIGMSSFTSGGYQDLSGVAYSAYGSTLSTVSTLFVDHALLGATSTALTALTSNVSTGIDTALRYDRQYFTTNYTLKSLYAYNSTQVDAYLTTLDVKLSNVNAGLLSTISFTSSIPPSGGGAVTGVASGGNFTMSSSYFTLGGMTDILQHSQKVVVEMNPSAVFDNGTVGILNVSSFLMSGTTLIPGSVFTRPLKTDNVGRSNLYTDTYSVELAPSDVLSASLNPIRLCHRVVGFTPGASLVTSNLMSATNSIHVRCFGNNFGGVY